MDLIAKIVDHFFQEGGSSEPPNPPSYGPVAVYYVPTMLFSVYQ